MNPDNIYFLNTPIEIQNLEYYNIIEKLNNFNISDNDYIYLLFSSIYNIPDKYFFKCYIKNDIIKDKNFNYEPDFLIF